MSEHESMSEETGVDTGGAGDRRAVDFEPFACCRAMAERMLRAFGGGPAGQAGERGGPVDPDPDSRRASMMARMMSACCGPRARDARPPDEKADDCCGDSE